MHIELYIYNYPVNPLLHTEISTAFILKNSYSQTYSVFFLKKISIQASVIYMHTCIYI